MGVPLPSKKDAAKNMARGTTKTVYDEKNCVTVWRDSQPVYLASNFAGPDPAGFCRRYAGREKGYVEFPCPRSVLTYNSTMGGIDLINQLTKCYRIAIRIKKWYWALYTWTLNVLMVQAWRLYQATMKQRHALVREAERQADVELEEQLEGLPRLQKEARRKEVDDQRKKIRKEEKKMEEKPLLDFIRECVEVILLRHSDLNTTIKARESGARLSGNTAKVVRYDMGQSHLVVETEIKGLCMHCRGRSFLRQDDFYYKKFDKQGCGFPIGSWISNFFSLIWIPVQPSSQKKHLQI